MKKYNAIAITTLILVTTFGGVASAGTSTGSLSTDVQSAAGAGHVSVILRNGVATLFGGVESQVDSNAAEMAAANFEGVECVINRISISN